MCLSLDRQPALELIEGTLAMWCKVITKGRVFDERTDVPRFREAFVNLGARKTWPVPSDFIEALPSNVRPFVRPLRLDDERTKKARLQSFAELSKLLRVPTPHNDDEPPRAA